MEKANGPGRTLASPIPLPLGTMGCRPGTLLRGRECPMGTLGRQPPQAASPQLGGTARARNEINRKSRLPRSGDAHRRVARRLLFGRQVHKCRRMERFDMSLRLDLALLRVLRRDLSSWLRRADVDSDVGENIVLATHEAAANAIEHADLGTEVTVLVRRSADELRVDVENVGAWKNWPAKDEPRGRGLVLMRELMSEVHIHSVSGRTRVQMQTAVTTT